MIKPLKLVFAGTPEFAVPALQALIESPHQLLAVYTQPDRPAGRGQMLQQSPVKQLAVKHDLVICQPKTLKSSQALSDLRALSPDLMVVVAYGLLLPADILAVPDYGCINIHASLLPRWRGAAPIQRAILAGDECTGITLMQMDEGLDSGAMLLKKTMAITADDSAQTLHDRLAKLGARSLLECLQGIQAGTISREKQDDRQATYAAKLNKHEAWVDWDQAAPAIVRQVRAFNPWPVAQSQYEHNGKSHRLRIWQAQALTEHREQSAGEIIAAGKKGIDVATSKGIVRLLQVQKAGGKPLSAADFINANDLTGLRFSMPVDMSK